MGDNRGDTQEAGAAHELEDELEDEHEGVGGGESLRSDLNPLRAAGWIFRDGDCIAIERQSEDLRTRVLAD
jgi:hypothetical protein